MPQPRLIARLVPAFSWLSSYRRADLRGDATAGVTTAVMLIPQAMAYAMLAGLPPIVGLYASMAPLAAYALFGSSRQLAVGPVAIVSLLVIAGAGALAEPGSSQYVGLAVVLALMTGVIQLSMGLLRLGMLTNFLSHPVISGFTSAAALIIGFSQLKHLLGIDIPRSQYLTAIARDALAHIGQLQLGALAIGGASIALLLLLERISPVFPRALGVVVVGTLAVWLFRLDQFGVAVVGPVPAGLPRPSLPDFDLPTITALLSTAVVIALVGFMESVSVARAVARRHRDEVDSNRELVGLGLANLAGALFGGYPVAGGFSRTAVNDQAGARTQMASLVTAATVALCLLVLTPLLHYLPKAVLAAIIIVSVFGLIDLHEVRRLWRVKRSDLVLLSLTFVATLLLGIEKGILTGVGVSMLWFVIRTTRPHAAVLGRLPGTEVYRNVENHPEACTVAGVLIARIDAQFYYGNVTFLKETLRIFEQRMDSPLKAVVVDASSINQLDSSAATALEEIAECYAERSVRLLFANVKQPVLAVMRRAGLDDLLGQDLHFLCVHDAVTAAGEERRSSVT